MALYGTVSAGNDLGMKNRLINGDMRIDQRNVGASITPGATFSYQLDRWTYGTSVASKISVQQVADAPAGFYNSLKLTSLSAYSIASGDRFILGQCIEGYNTSDLGWGTANAQTVTVSFWVKSSLTGTFACSFNNTAGSYSYVTTYTISSANTWEKKTVTIPGVTSGVWNTGTNSGSIWVVFDIGTGSTYQTGTLNTWQNAFYENATGVIALPATNGATWQVTGVQFEKGSTATSFDYRSFGTELTLCQRYYSKSYNHDVVPGTATQVGMEVCAWQGAGGVGGAYGNVKFPVKMRTTPGTINIWDGAGTATSATSYTYGGGGSAQAIANGGAWWGSGTPFNTSYSGFFMRPTGTQPSAWNYVHYTADAEL
jgi:hypothetical protein